MQTHVPRSVPVCLSGKPVVVSYSDGEDTGGVGVAVWHPRLVFPLAAYLQVPSCLRDLWALQRGQGSVRDHRDIYEIEAIGPLLLLDRWPQLFEGALWVHFIDNAAAQASLTRGSSSVMNGEVIVGLTWKRIVDLWCSPWFDRVSSSRNPVDGLSRGRFEGPWQRVETISFPNGLLEEIEHEVSRFG